MDMEDGKIAVKLARESIETFIRDGRRTDIVRRTLFDEDMGVFVTINKDKQLRGCIGYPYPIKPLGEAIVDSAINAATNDPRFPPLSIKELAEIKIEVTILGKPEKLGVKPKDLPKEIKIGRDGLIVKRGVYQGLLLPQVPVEWNWDTEEFLCQTCFKAGLPPDCWLDDSTEVYRFKGQIFEEKDGEIVEKEI
ncbi:MAG: hypothetical protein MASP_00340 [Candidatus Methanolliviera sp. GoM_asphalt]|nr:MAG: hypothetical protein MASP_00340 [Candidatus Methanolliviera sp. GoM_asphalt]